MKRGTAWLVIAIAIGFGIELATNSIGNDAALLRIGALPDNGQLRGEFWRIATFSFLHFNWVHLGLNVGLLWWIGRIVERQVGTGPGALIYFVSVICSAVVILLVHTWHPKEGATVGASGGVFGLLGAALIIFYRQDRDERLRKWLWRTRDWFCDFISSEHQSGRSRRRNHWRNRSSIVSEVTTR